MHRLLPLAGLVLPELALAQNAEVFVELEFILRVGPDPGVGAGLEAGLSAMPITTLSPTAGVFARADVATGSPVTVAGGGRAGAALAAFTDCVGYIPIAQAEASFGPAWSREGPGVLVGGSLSSVAFELGFYEIARPGPAPRWTDPTASLGLRLPLLPACIAGRPLRDGEAALVADVGGHPWADRARDEHAAISAFLRLAAELVDAGAPRALVRAALAAARDEVRHARLTLALASRDLDRPLRLPALLPWRARGGTRATRLARLVGEGLRDGLINEGAAALEAAGSARTAADPVVRAVEATIAAEEARHALLGLAVARWAAGQLGATTVDASA